MGKKRGGRPPTPEPVLRYTLYEEGGAAVEFADKDGAAVSLSSRAADGESPTKTVWLGSRAPENKFQFPMELDRGRAAVLAQLLNGYARHGTLLPPTRVASVRGLNPAEVERRGIVYVGRPHYSYGADRKLLFPGHALANPFRVGPDPTPAALRSAFERYAVWLHDDPERVRVARSLRGECLGCWCGEWDGFTHTYPRVKLLCHAVLIAWAAEEVGP